LCKLCILCIKNVITIIFNKYIIKILILNHIIILTMEIETKLGNQEIILEKWNNLQDLIKEEITLNDISK